MPVNQSILITGISGFTGLHLAQMLRQDGNRVFGISNVKSQHNGRDVFYAPLENTTALKNAVKAIKPDYVIHLAGISFANHDNALKYYNVNVLGTENLLKACLVETTNIKKIIIASSAAIYGNPIGVDFVSEKQPPAPNSHYGCSKLAMEHIVGNYTEHLPILITRPFNYTGPGQPSTFLIPKIVSHFKNKLDTIELGNTAIIREFSDVRDACHNYIELLDQPGTGVVNLCSGFANSFDDILNTLKILTGHDISIEVNPKFVRKNDIIRLVGNSATLQKMVKRKPRYELKQTLAAMLNSEVAH